MRKLKIEAIIELTCNDTENVSNFIGDIECAIFELNNVDFVEVLDWKFIDESL